MWVVRPIGKHLKSLLRCTQQKVNNGISATAAADRTAADWPMLLFSREKSAPVRCGLSSKFFDHLFCSMKQINARSSYYKELCYPGFI